MKAAMRKPITPEQQERRKKVMMATLITCITLAMVGGSLHVIELGSMRLEEMRMKAGYDLADEHKHIRAAGEDLHIQDKHEALGGGQSTYSQAEVETLVDAKTWAKLDSMVLIPAGVFTMGSDFAKANDEDKPAHQVRMPAYKIDVYPVTNVQYARFVVAKKYRPPLHWKDGHIPQGLKKHPVTLISWYNARDYCAWQGKRLPSEAEWEKAARGDDARRWPWGNRMDIKRLNTYYTIGSTTAVDAYPKGASPYGVMDLSGNVQEWVADLFRPYEGSAGSKTIYQPKALDASYVRGSDEEEHLIFRVMRGGSFKSDPFSTAAYHRNYSLPNYASDFFGFRCAKDLKEASPSHE